MKRSIMILTAILITAGLFAAGKDIPLTPEQEADILYSEKNSVTDTAVALAKADVYIAAYKKLFETAPSDERLFKYVKAVDFKNYYLSKNTGEARRAYKELLSVADKFCGGNTSCASSNYMSYVYMTLWGRYGELIDIMEAATSGIAGKVKDYAERMYASDKTFKDYAASYTLGRLHYKAPNIIFILTWPDKNLSRKYLEEYLAANPDVLFVQFFLADTLWDLGDREKATALYKKVMAAEPLKDRYFEDMKAKEICGARMAEQGIK